jgi:hypothetical protein
MSCLFNSLSYFVSIDSFTLRQTICDYLEQNRQIIDGLDTNFVLALESGTTAAEYIRCMRNMSEWGGAPEIQAACNLWNMCIIVRNYRNRGSKNIEFVPLSGTYDRTIELYWTGGHYEPIRNS